jgi:chromosome segregation ATPase
VSLNPEPNPTSLPAAPVNAGAPKGIVTVGEVVNAWQRTGRRAAALQKKLDVVSKVSRQRYEDLTRLARVTRKRREQNESLQARLLTVLERQAPQSEAAPDEDQILREVEEGSDQDQVPIHYARVLFKRLRESQKLVQEYDTLLELRERQVQEMLPAFQPKLSEDFVVVQLQSELEQMRHRVRLLTAELLLAPEQAKIAELTGLCQRLQSELQARPVAESDSDVMLEFTSLQDEVSRLQDEVLHLQEENDRLQSAEPSQTERLAQAEAFFNQLINQLTEENNSLKQKLSTVADPSADVAQLNARIQQLQAALDQSSAANPDRDRTARLEAAVTDLRAKLQLAASKYQEVKEALLKKHKQLQELQSRSVETDEKTDFTVSVVQTLESALGEATRQAESRQVELEQARAQLVDSQKKLSEREGVEPHSEGAGDPGSLEAKLKEARRSAVRAQAEAGLKRKEASKLQDEVEALKARLAAAGL